MFAQPPPPPQASAPPVYAYGQPAPVYNQQHQLLASPQPQQQFGTVVQVDDGPKPQTGAQGARLASSSGYRDPVWALLWIVQTIVVIVVAIVFYKKFKDDNETAGFTAGMSLNARGWKVLAVFLVAGAGLSLLLLAVVQRYAKQFIWFSLLASLAMTALWAVICLAAGAVGAGVIFLIMAALDALWIYLVKSRIPFSACVLETVCGVLRRYPSNLVIAFASVIAQGVWLLVWAIAALSVFYQLDKAKASNGKFFIVYFVMCVSLYWTAQVVKNVVHVTVAGLMATWYFLDPHGMPPNPTSRSFKRATTTSLGSICLGSLVVAVIRSLKAVCDQATRAENEFVRCVVMCLVQCLEDMMTYFNQYAFAQVAIYGKPYCAAAKDTWELLKARGMDALVNDQLISSALGIAALIVGVTMGGLGALLGRAWLSNWGLWCALGFACGLLLALCATEAVESAVCALFVCWAEDPQALAASKPQVYAALDAAINGRTAELHAQPH